MKKIIKIRRAQLEFSEGVKFHVTNIQLNKWNIQKSLCILQFITVSAVSQVQIPGISKLRPLQICIQLTLTHADGWWHLWIPHMYSFFPSFIVMAFFQTPISPSWGNCDSLLPGLPGLRSHSSQTHHVHYYFCVIFSKKPPLSPRAECHGLQNAISLTPVFNLYTAWECFVSKSVSPK